MMRMAWVAAVLPALILGAGGARAGTLDGGTFDVGACISHIKYEEPGLMDEKGFMYGVVLDFTYRKGIMFALQGRGAYGQVDYSGATWEGAPLEIKGIPDYLGEARGVVGFDLLADQIYLTPYFGAGYRYLNDGLQKKSSGGYEREANYLYSPAGAELIFELDDGWFLGGRVEYDIFWQGRQVSHMSDFDRGYNDPKNDQKKGYGIKGSVAFGRRGDGVGFSVEPFVNYWDIEQSDEALLTYYGIPEGYVMEPKNKSTEFGVNLKLVF